MVRLQQRIDRFSTVVSAAMLGVMTVILVYNVGARFLGGGISWYMESSQYINVWAMCVAGVGICASGQHLRITALEEILPPSLKKLDRILIAAATIIFYLGFAYGTFLLAAKSKQAISTMPALKMAHVYWLLPVCGLLSALSTALELAINLTVTAEKEERS